MRAYLRLLRLNSWKGYFALSILGLVLSGAVPSLIETIVFFLILICFLGTSFSINDYTDVTEDKLHGSKTNPIAAGEIELRNALVFSLTLAFIGLALSLSFGIKAFVYYVIMLATAFFYSVPPLRFKTKFPLDFLTHGLFFGSFILVLPFMLFGASLTSAHLIPLLFSFWTGIIPEFENHVRDYESDKQAGLRTTACVLGPETTARIANFLKLLLPIIVLPAFFAKNFLIFVLTSLVFYAVYLFKYKQRSFYVYESLVLVLFIINTLL
ncbi:MAG: UbiA family prenyltransferase [Candidatus Altiarchaeota archaeon]|nr:UbiA family prenyltransferase [Candidatus Altiarchaeota archaeon]